MSTIIKKKLTISGMHCTACAMNIDFDLEDIDGVLSAKTNYAKQESEIEMDTDKVQMRVIIDAIEKLNYKVIEDSE